MKLGEIVNTNFDAALGKLIKQDLPFKTAYKLKKIVDFISPEIKQFQEHRSALINKYCMKKEDGTPDLNENGEFQLVGENLVNAQKELFELSEIELVGPHLISLEEISTATLSANDIFGLAPILSE